MIPHIASYFSKAGVDKRKDNKISVMEVCVLCKTTSELKGGSIPSFKLAGMD